jgi:hypothetical protein
MFMRYLGGGIGHRTQATPADPVLNGIGIIGTQGDPDFEMDLEEVGEDTVNHTQGHQVDDIEDPNEEDYERDNMSCNEAVVQDDELEDYEYTQGLRAQLERDLEEEELEGIDGYDLGPEDGEDDGYYHSELEYE